MTDQQLPQSTEAEQSVLGASMLSKAAFLSARAVLSDDDWFRPSHAMIWEVIADFYGDGKSGDVVSVAEELLRRDQINKTGGRIYLHDLVAGVPTAINVEHHAAIVAQKAVLRRLVEAGVRISQMGYSADAGVGIEGSVDDAVQRAKDEVAVLSRVSMDEESTAVDVHDLMDEELPTRWLIPGLLSEGERMLLTAAEGLGKSTMLRQLLVCAAAGMHPFSQRFMDPIRCLGFDYENGRRLSQDRYRPLLAAARISKRPVERDMLKLEIRPRGVNLLQPASAAKVLRMVERFKPQLVMIGPIYRLHEGDPNDERDARKISVVLDQIREVSGAAVITEGHMAKGANGQTRSLNPVGSGLWMRWPEYGYGLVLSEDSDLHQRQVALKPWRGPRDERSWPELLMSGSAANRPWPWVEVTPKSRDGFVNPYGDDDPSERKF